MNNKNIFVIDHPLLKSKLSILRDKNTPSNVFRTIVKEITTLISYEVLKNVELIEYPIETPISKTVGYKLKNNINVFPVLRAGQGMVGGVEILIPSIRVGHIGLYRDEKTLKPVKYLFKTPELQNDSLNIILDPMLATGGSIIEAIDILKLAGAKEIIVVGILASKKAIENIRKKHPYIKIYLSAIDEELNKNGYIVPGLGDAGDRIFGTK